MTFKIFISSAIVSAIITTFGTIIAAKIAQKTARETAQETANQEIKKMERTWEREDLVSSDEEFAEMASIVSKYVSFGTGAWSDEAIAKVAAIRSKEKGELGKIMDDLYKCIMDDMYVNADRLLTKAINEKRRLKS